MTLSEVKTSIERMRLVLSDPTVSHPGIDSQRLWLDEMTMIVAIIEHVSLLERGQTGLGNGQKVLLDQITAQQQDIIARLDDILARDIMPPIVNDQMLRDFIVEIRRAVTGTTPVISDELMGALADVVNGWFALEQALPFLITRHHPTFVFLQESVKQLQQAMKGATDDGLH